MKKIAIILCGSGFKDGSEIRESVGVLWALSQHPVSVHCFAPDSPQKDVVNCLTGQPSPHEARNMLVESARIARGNVKALSQLNANDFQALIIPGGFGVAKNLCTFATQGSGGSVNGEVKVVLQKFYDEHKPIGAVCIAPALLALAFQNQNFEMTLGSKSEAALELQKLGHQHTETKADECCVDKNNKIVSTPAYMYDSAPLHEIFSGIHKLVGAVLELT